MTAVNTGNGMEYVDGVAEVHELGGALVGKAPLASGLGTMLPDMPREFSASGGRALRDGPYIVSIALKAVQGAVLYRDLAYIIVKSGAVETAKPTLDAIAAMKALVPRLRVDPPSVDLVVPPRGRTTSTLTLTSQVTEALPVSLKLMSWRTSASGEVELCSATDQPSDASSWVRLDQSEVVVPPRGSVRVRVSVAVPQGAKGERYAAIVATPTGQANQPSLNNAVLFAISAKGTVTEGAAVTRFVAAKQNKGGYKFLFTVSNTGNTRIAAGGSIRVVSATGGRGDTGSAIPIANGNVLVMPGATRELTVEWPQVLAPGSYTATAVLGYAETKQMTASTTIYVRESAGTKTPVTKLKPVPKKPARTQ